MIPVSNEVVGINDSRDGTLETVLNSLAHVLAGAKLLTDTLVDKHVGIHCRTHRKHDTCDTRQRQYSRERRQDTYQQEYVAQQCEVGNQARNQTIVEDHVQQDQHKAQRK
jgi:hypothetical protein